MPKLSKLVRLAALLVLTKQGRRFLALAGTATVIYALAAVMVTVPLLWLIGLALWALLATVAALLYRRRGRTTPTPPVTGAELWRPAPSSPAPPAAGGGEPVRVAAGGPVPIPAKPTPAREPTTAETAETAP